MALCFLHVSYCFRLCAADASPTFHTYMTLTCLHVTPTENDSGTYYASSSFDLIKQPLMSWSYNKQKIIVSLCFSPCSQAANRPGGAPYSRSGEGESGAEAEGWDQRSQAGGPTTEGAAWGHSEWTESPKVRWRRARTGTCKVKHVTL